LAELKNATKSEATKRAYKSDFDLFGKWCAETKFDFLTALPEAVALYLLKLYRDQTRPSTIGRKLAAISQAHKLAGFGSPINAQVREVKKGIDRKLGKSKRQAKPISVEHLERIVETADRDLIGTRDCALILLGWSAALRRSELVALDLDDLEDVGEGVVINIRKSKTDQTGEGARIGVPFAREKKLCPVLALRKWLRMSRISSGPIFRNLGRGQKGRSGYLFGGFVLKNRLSDKMVSLIVKKLMGRAGYDGAQYSGHSLRSGFATAAAAAGISDRDIMRITGHKSTKILGEYIRDGSIFRDHPLNRLL
jgi:integrase